MKDTIPQEPVTSNREPVWGAVYASSAFLLWGFSPIYFKAVGAAPAFEILMHRIVWSFFLLLPAVLIMGQWKALRTAVMTFRILSVLLGTTLLVSANWFIFIWAVNHDQILQTSLGYYINPLVNVLLGVVFLRERLRPLQVMAVILAGTGVVYLTWSYGKLPWISLTLAFTFGFYGLIRKVAPVNALVGLTVETMLLCFPALAYLAFLMVQGKGAFLRSSINMDILLISAALVTAPPLLLFTVGARKIHLSTVGILQYIAPSCTFLLAVWVYHEPFSSVQVWTFGLIWTALFIYSWDSVMDYKKTALLNQAS